MSNASHQSEKFLTSEDKYFFEEFLGMEGDVHIQTCTPDAGKRSHIKPLENMHNPQWSTSPLLDSALGKVRACVWVCTIKYKAKVSLETISSTKELKHHCTLGCQHQWALSSPSSPFLLLPFHLFICVSLSFSACLTFDLSVSVPCNCFWRSSLMYQRRI